MNLYFISQTVVHGWDTYDSAVVAAENEELARCIHPSREDWDGKREDWDGWCNKEDVTVKLIGTATEGLAGVICASYNAG
jgi:hypothetical protein